MRKRKIYIYVLLMLTLFIGFISSMDVLASDQISYSNISFEEQYVLNEEVQIPKNTLSVDGQSIDMESIVYLPSGIAYRTDSIMIEEVGLYRIVYQSQYNQEHYEDTYTFYGVNNLYSFKNIF